MKDVIAEELNVKDVIIDEDEEKLVTLSAKANFKKLGPQLGKNMRLAAAAIANLEYSQISSLLQGNNLSLTIDDGFSIDITLDDIEIRREEKEGLMAANDDDITVALDMNITEELEMEGWAREIVNRLQNMRKEADLDVADRIKIYYSVPEPIQNALTTFNSYIAGETLAETIEANNGNFEEFSAVKMGDYDCFFSIEKTG